MKKLLLAMILLVCTGLCAKAQTISWSEGSKAIPPSGRTSAILKGVEIQPGLHQGIHTTHIPIFSIADIGMDLSLSYHATGLRVNERSSSVGTGWNLNAGGVVGRIIRGLPDDSLNVGYLYLNSTEIQLLNTEVVSYTNSDLANLNTLMGKDTEPDIFYFNVNGMSGKFILDENITIINGSGNSTGILLSKGNVRIKYFVKNNEINAFWITTADGITYRFEDYIEKADVKKSLSRPVNMAWYLASIRTNAYTFCELSYTNINIEEWHLKSENAYYTTSTASETVNSPVWEEIDYTIPQVTAITFPSGSATITYDATTKLVNQIKITNSTAELNKYFKFDYTTYSQSGTSAYAETAAPNNRYKLTKFYEKQGDNEIAYTFDYESTSIPPINSWEMDYWGFYNNNGATTFLPSIWGYTDGYELFQRASGSDEFSTAGANRSVNSTYSKAGVLTKITSPLGAVSEFEYESNTFLFEGNSKNAGGLRIKKVKSYDQASPTKFTETNFNYTYKDSGSLSAKLIQKPEFAIRNHSSMHFNLTSTEKLRRATFRSALPLEQNIYNFQPVIFYEEVISSNTNGSVVTSYDFPFNYNDWLSYPGSHTGLFPTTSAAVNLLNTSSGDVSNYTELSSVSYPYPVNPCYDWSDIILTKKRVYDPSGHLENKTEYEYYEADHLVKQHAQILNPVSAYTNSPTTINYKNVSKYYYISAWKLLKKTIDTIFDDNNNPLCKTQEYVYDPGIYRHANRITSTDHFGIKKSIVRKYTTHEDFNPFISGGTTNIPSLESNLQTNLENGGLSFDDAYYYSEDTNTKEWYDQELETFVDDYNFKLIKTVQSRFLYNILIEELYTIHEGDDERIMNGSFNKFQIEMSNIHPFEGYSLNKQLVSTDPFNFSTFETPNTNYELDYYNVELNDQEDIVEFTRKDSVKVSFVVQDGNSKIEALNVDYDNIKTYDGTNLSTIQANNPNAFIKENKFINMIGVTEETDAKGRKTYYVYDEFGNLVATRDHDKNIISANYSYMHNFTKLPDEQQNLLISDPIVGMEYINDYYTADFTYTGTLMTNETITFRIQSDYKSYLTYNVNFGDGSSTTLSSRECTHSYSNAGSYSVVIQAYYDGSLVSSCTKLVKILRPLPPPF